MEDLKWLFSVEGFVPRSECGEWSETLMRLAIHSNTIIGIGYILISLGIAIAWRRRMFTEIRPISYFAFTGIFFTCGTGHILGKVLIFYVAAYRLDVAWDVLTAAFAVIGFPQLAIIVHRMSRQIIAARDVAEDATEDRLAALREKFERRVSR